MIDPPFLARSTSDGPGNAQRPSLTLAAAQTRSIDDDVPGNVRRHVAAIAAAAREGVDFLVFPELSLTGYRPQTARGLALAAHADALAPLREAARAAAMTVVVGAPVRDEGRDPVFIGAIVLRPDGAPTTYTKQHLHPGEERAFAPGAGGPLVEVGDVRVATAICADYTHAAHPRAAALAGADVYAAGALVTAAGLARERALMAGYAAEHAMPVLFANHGGTSGGWEARGASGAWDAAGRSIVTAPEEGEWLAVARRDGGAWTGWTIPLA